MLRRIYEMTIITNSEAETELEGEKIGRKLSAGSIIALQGNLGAGKTTLTRGIAKGLGIEEGVSSPTFTIVNEYPAPVPLYHFDMYRLENATDLYDIGWYDYIDQGGVCVVEWSEKVYEAFPPETKVVMMETIGENKRKITISEIGKPKALLEF